SIFELGVGCPIGYGALERVVSSHDRLLRSEQRVSVRAGAPRRSCRGILSAPPFVHKVTPHPGAHSEPNVTSHRGDRMTRRTEVQGKMRTVVRLAILAAGLASLGACASIPQRVWANGQAMTSSRAYRSVMSGNMSMQAHRELQWSLDPLRLN